MFIVTMLTKIFVKRLIARASVKLFIPVLDVPIVAALNYVQALGTVRQMRLGLALPSPLCLIFNELLGNSPMSFASRVQVLRALGTSCLHHQCVNPASHCLIENAWLVCGGASLGARPQVPTREKKFGCMIFLLVAWCRE